MKINKCLKYFIASLLVSAALVPCAMTAFAEQDEPPVIPDETVSEPAASEVSVDPDPEPSVDDDPIEPVTSQDEDEISTEPQEPSEPVYYPDEDDDEPQVPETSYVYVEPSHYHVYDDNNDTYDYSYEYEYSYPETAGYEDDGPENSEDNGPPKDTSSLDISGYEISDNTVLTSQDWEELKNSGKSENSSFELNPTPATAKTTDAFKKLKEDSKGGNDDWIFLVAGISLICLGGAAIGVVIFLTVRAKKKR